MSRIIVLVKYAKPKKDYLSENRDDVEDERGLDRKTRRKLGLDNDEDDEDSEFGMDDRFEKMFNTKNLEFYYKPYGINTNEIHDFYPLDEEHTILVAEYGGLLPVKIAWNDWLSLWEKHSGEAIFIVDKPTSIKIK